MAYVLKVECEGELRRVLANRSEGGKLSFAEVEGRIRDVFKFPSTSELKLTYQDKDGDIVTMANDADLTDACIIQELNPLRLHVALSSTSSSSAAEDMDVETDVERSLAEIVEKLVGSFEPVFRKFFTADQMPELLNHIVERVTDSINSPASSAQPTDPSSNIPTDSNKAEGRPEIHASVTCDVCEMSPIVGPRYKSMKKFNYDLCGSCYKREGNANEYKRIEPFPRHGPASSNLGDLRLNQLRNMHIANLLWRASPGMLPPFVCGPRVGRCRMGYVRS